MLALPTWKVCYEYKYPVRAEYQGAGICSENVFVQAASAKEANDTVIEAGRRGSLNRQGHTFFQLRPNVETEMTVPLLLADSAVKKLRDYLEDFPLRFDPDRQGLVETASARLIDDDRVR